MEVLALRERVIGPLVKRAAIEHGDRVFFEYRDTHVTFRELDEAVDRCARGLQRLGVVPNEKIAIMTPNCPEFLYAWFGANRLGAVYVPINTDYKGEILQYVLNKADVRCIVIDARYLDRLRFVEDQLPTLTAVIVRRDPTVAPTGVALSSRLQVLDFAELLGGEGATPASETLYTDPAAISFTSGTTGPSKGVLATHCHVVTFALDWIKANDFGPGDTLYTCLPFFHAIAAWLGILPAIIVGARVAAVERFSASSFWADVRRYRATLVHGIFSMVPILLKQPPSPDDAAHTARTFYIGQLNEEFERRFNCRIVEVYGATETGIVTYTPYRETRRNGSCGKANRETYEVKILDGEDQECPPGTVGEIAVRPVQPYSMIQEYYNMPEETLAAFRNLWFHTGDNGRMDEDGYFYFVDRKKDAIRRRGENISSYEVERVVNAHPAVLECAAVAVPSELAEDEVKIVVVFRPGSSLSPEELLAFCDERMPRFWVPRYVEYRDALPKTPNQKVQKYLLREGQPTGMIWDREAVVGRSTSRR